MGPKAVVDPIHPKGYAVEAVGRRLPVIGTCRQNDLEMCFASTFANTTAYRWITHSENA